MSDFYLITPFFVLSFLNEIKNYIKMCLSALMYHLNFFVKQEFLCNNSLLIYFLNKELLMVVKCIMHCRIVTLKYLSCGKATIAQKDMYKDLKYLKTYIFCVNLSCFQPYNFSYKIEIKIRMRRKIIYLVFKNDFGYHATIVASFTFYF